MKLSVEYFSGSWAICRNGIPVDFFYTRSQAETAIKTYGNIYLNTANGCSFI